MLCSSEEPILTSSIRIILFDSEMTIESTLDGRLLRRELEGSSGPASVSGIYGLKKFVDDLDIVNELHAHSGCVNALR